MGSLIFLHILFSVLGGDDISTGDPDAILERFMSNIDRSRSVSDKFFYSFILVTFYLYCTILS